MTTVTISDSAGILSSHRFPPLTAADAHRWAYRYIGMELMSGEFLVHVEGATDWGQVVA